MTEHTIGISKSYFDAFRLEGQTAGQFENTPRGIRALVRWLGRAPVARIVFEPTGRELIGQNAKPRRHGIHRRTSLQGHRDSQGLQRQRGAKTPLTNPLSLGGKSHFPRSCNF